MGAFKFKKEIKNASYIKNSNPKKPLLTASATPLSATEIRIRDEDTRTLFDIQLATDTVLIHDGNDYVDVTANGSEAICDQLRDEVLFKEEGSGSNAYGTLQQTTDAGSTTNTGLSVVDDSDPLDIKPLIELKNDGGDGRLSVYDSVGVEVVLIAGGGISAKGIGVGENGFGTSGIVDTGSDLKKYLRCAYNNNPCWIPILLILP